MSLKVQTSCSFLMDLREVQKLFGFLGPWRRFLLVWVLGFCFHHSVFTKLGNVLLKTKTSFQVFLSYKNKVTSDNFVNILKLAASTIRQESNPQLLFILPTNGSNKHQLPQLQLHLHSHITTLPVFMKIGKVGFWGKWGEEGASRGSESTGSLGQSVGPTFLSFWI